TGGRYSSAGNTWIATNTTNAPAARDEHTAVWTGSEMIVWGGIDAFGLTNTGGRYCSQHPTPTPTPTATPTATVSPFACSFFENFDGVTPPGLPARWAAVNAIDPDGILW